MYDNFILADEDSIFAKNAHDLALYKHFVQHLSKKMPTFGDDLMHAAIGIAGEAGELLDAVKKTWVYNKVLDRANVVEELGDLNFYMQHLQNLLQISDDEIVEANIAKLRKRYAEGYSDKAAQERVDKLEETAGVDNYMATIAAAIAGPVPGGSFEELYKAAGVPISASWRAELEAIKTVQLTGTEIAALLNEETQDGNIPF